ncbi:DUF6356 family protein [Sphingomonas quercus]|uniref:Capsule biosynthesis protein n=1 Tax=Sphingomonas quercus TaxID=2842451 RepID=A0ABS6BKH3_9SPHN|nr:DUF6356 family protein [Sphingomonas quercus]MBU3078794.1 hypothetical protein [Sphingomonas quercus]
MIDRLFLAHPRTVGESYGAHFRTALGFGTAMVAGGLACIAHAFVPALCVRTGSDTVKRLYGRMKARQPAFRDAAPAYSEPQWQLEYEI